MNFNYREDINEAVHINRKSVCQKTEEQKSEYVPI